MQLAMAEIVRAQAPAQIDAVRALESRMFASADRLPFTTYHLLHGGMYARTIRAPKGIQFVSALIVIPTVIIINGHVLVGRGGESQLFRGYNVVAASAQRKLVYLTYDDTDITMLFPTQFKTVAECEHQFTTETELLHSNNDHNVVHITGE